MKKMTPWGVGPKIMFPGYAILIVFSWLPIKVNISEILYIPRTYLTIAAIILIGIGILILAAANADIRQALKANRLITTGLYSRIRNPMYTSHIFFIMPGTCLLTNNIVVFLSLLFTFIFFNILIPKEEKDLEDNFGGEYLRYKARTRRLLPKLLKTDK
ncbi:MAG: isoprenylcysteine carboxylmethyltransferase family protein [Deltaproteobacteria bacterium]|nr:isoprenylcysteine carboxylmethyltransferase family protein [Deltaproteobacteria bacterium]